MKQIVALIFGLGLFGNALLFVPQIFAVWRKRSDEGISLVTFGGFCILQVVGVIHGYYQQDLSLILGLGASFLTCGTATALTIFYRMRRLRAERGRAAALAGQRVSELASRHPARGSGPDSAPNFHVRTRPSRTLIR